MYVCKCIHVIYTSHTTTHTHTYVRVCTCIPDIYVYVRTVHNRPSCDVPARNRSRSSSLSTITAAIELLEGMRTKTHASQRMCKYCRPSELADTHASQRQRTSIKQLSMRPRTFASSPVARLSPAARLASHARSWQTRTPVSASARLSNN